MYAQKMHEFMMNFRSSRQVNSNQFQQQQHQLKKQLKLSTLKRDFHKLQQLIEEFDERRTQLHEQIGHLAENQWNDKLCAINALQQQILEIVNWYERPEVIKQLNKMINKRKKRHDKMKKERITFNQTEKDSRYLRTQELHQKIDQWQREQRDKETAKKKVEQVPYILNEVLRKKTDSNRYVDLIDNLIVLRRKRRIQSGRSELGEKHFEAEMDKLRKMWTKMTQQYEMYEQELRQHFIDKEQSVEKAWMQTIFGTTQKQNGPCEGIDYNLSDFLQNRQMWDMCLVPASNPLGSSIPMGWIYPPDCRNILPEWKVYSLNDSTSSAIQAKS